MSMSKNVHAQGSNDKKMKATVSRHEQRSGGLCAGLQIQGTGRPARASLLRIAAELEERLDGLTDAPVCISTRGDGSPYLWIEGDCTENDIEVGLHILTLAASKAGFFMRTREA